MCIQPAFGDASAGLPVGHTSEITGNADLSEIVACWPVLPAAIRKALLVLAKYRAATTLDSSDIRR